MLSTEQLDELQLKAKQVKELAEWNDLDAENAIFVCEQLPYLLQELKEWREVRGKIEGMKRTPTKHDRCVLDDSWCYDHSEIMQDGDEPNGAHDFNQALNDVLALLPKEKL